MEPSDPRFAVDAMLGRLARWLRLLGYDATYDPSLDDRELARIAASSGRVVLTRDRGLLARRLVRRGLLVDHDHLADQLRCVVAAFALAVDPTRCFTRCLECNDLTREVGREEVPGRVPPYVLRHAQSFHECPRCRRVFWAGTHRQLALRELERLFPRA